MRTISPCPILHTDGKLCQSSTNCEKGKGRRMEDDQVENWSENEFGDVALGDERRRKRLMQLATALGKRPSGSLPQALGSYAALKAAYRFFENPANEHQDMLKSHVQATYRRMAEMPLVLAIQDTTYLDWTHHPHTTGLGPTGVPYLLGAIMHSTLAITPERVALGVLHEQIWARDADTYAKLKDNSQRAIREKESIKWLISLDSIIEAHNFLPDTHFVSVGDREADIYELFAKERPIGVDLLVRATQNRCLDKDEHPTLWKALAARPLAATFELQVPRTKKHPARIAQIEVRWKQVDLRPPNRPVGQKLPVVKVWAIWANEPVPPEGVEAVEWMLLTTVAVTSTEEALERLEWYSCRWGIEIWHKILKSGCRIEARQLDDLEKLKRLLVLFSVVAWRILYSAMLARILPDTLCTIFFEPEEWQAAYCILHNTTILPQEEPTLREAVRMVAQLGGFLDRKGDGEPGVTVLWKGFQRLYDLTQMYKLLRPPDLRQ